MDQATSGAAAANVLREEIIKMLPQPSAILHGGNKGCELVIPMRITNENGETIVARELVSDEIRNLIPENKTEFTIFFIQFPGNNVTEAEKYYYKKIVEYLQPPRLGEKGEHLIYDIGQDSFEGLMSTLIADKKTISSISYDPTKNLEETKEAFIARIKSSKPFAFAIKGRLYKSIDNSKIVRQTDCDQIKLFKIENNTEEQADILLEDGDKKSLKKGETAFITEQNGKLGFVEEKYVANSTIIDPASGNSSEAIPRKISFYDLSDLLNLQKQVDEDKLKQSQKQASDEKKPDDKNPPNTITRTKYSQQFEGGALNTKYTTKPL